MFLLPLSYLPSFTTRFTSTNFPTIGKQVHCYYCRNCTTHVYHWQEALGDRVIARTGLLDLDGSKGFKPAAEIYGKLRYGWEKELAETHETLPPNL